MGAKAIKTCCKHVNKLPPMALVAGVVAAFCGGDQFASAVVGTVAGLVTVNSAAGAREEIGSQIGSWWSTGPAPGLKQEEVDKLRRFFVDHDAKALLPGFSDFEMVSRAINF